MARILLLYDSRDGLTEQLADSVEEGIAGAGAECLRKRIEDAVPQDMIEADGIILGSPNWSGMIRQRPVACRAWSWVCPAQFGDYALPAAHRRIAQRLLREEGQLELGFQP